jgi:hypothetical protein
MDTNSLPASDFKDLLDLLSEHKANFNNIVTSNIQHESALRGLKQQSNDIDAHYGWALASDSALIARMFEEEERSEAKMWMKRLFEEYEERKEMTAFL